MQRSVVIDGSDYYGPSETRTSSSAYFLKGQDAVIQCIEERAAFISGIPVEQVESLQVVWYTVGQKFEPHLDWFERDLLTDYWGLRGQRYLTMLAYLNDEGLEGGHTAFSLLNISIPPKKNTAVFWYNVDKNELEDERTLHEGQPILKGEKWAINIWQRKNISSDDQS